MRHSKFPAGERGLSSFFDIPLLFSFPNEKQTASLETILTSRLEGLGFSFPFYVNALISSTFTSRSLVHGAKEILRLRRHGDSRNSSYFYGIGPSVKVLPFVGDYFVSCPSPQ